MPGYVTDLPSLVLLIVTNRDYRDTGFRPTRGISLLILTEEKAFGIETITRTNRNAASEKGMKGKKKE